MFERVLQSLRKAVEAGHTIFTPHSQEEMNEEELFIFDLEQCVLTGAIIERQWDDTYQDWKYVIHGKSADGDQIAVVVKSDQRGQVVFITTFRL